MLSILQKLNHLAAGEKSMIMALLWLCLMYFSLSSPISGVTDSAALEDPGTSKNKHPFKRYLIKNQTQNPQDAHKVYTDINAITGTKLTKLKLSICNCLSTFLDSQEAWSWYAYLFCTSTPSPATALFIRQLKD